MPEAEACAAEASAAAKWFAEQLYENGADQQTIFEDRLRDLLIKRFEGHWYPEEPHRGCAYRALISTVSCVDPLLMRAAEATGQRGLCESFMRVFSDVGEVNCWINPGEVKVLKGRSQHIVYSDGTGSDNPYEKLRIKIEATRLAVKVDPVEHIPSSPAGSSHNGSNAGMGDGGFGSFRPLGNGGPQSGSSRGCSNSQSPTESPMQSWAAGSRNGLPAMAPLPPNIGGNGGSFNSISNGASFGSQNLGPHEGQGPQAGAGFGYSSGLDASSMAGLGSMGGMGASGGGFGGGFGGANAMQQQQQQQQQSASGVPHSSPIRAGYPPYGSTPVF